MRMTIGEVMNRKQILDLLTEEFISCGTTHENAPPHKDCSDCGVSLEDQIAASNPVMSPVRSGGKKHKKCMDCWCEYLEQLTDHIVL
jgi:hypothetical protein